MTTKVGTTNERSALNPKPIKMTLQEEKHTVIKNGKAQRFR